jgi:hypothetical protein
MGGGRPILGLLAMFFTAGAILLIFLTLLGGTSNVVPLNDIYFLQVQTANIPGAPSVSRWTFWNLCGIDAGGKSQCGSSHPAFPLDPPSDRNFNTTTNIPSQFIGTDHFFLMTRFMFPFILIGLFFAVGSLFTGLLTLCTRVGGFLSSSLSWVALIFQIISSSLMTAAYVEGRDAFNSNNHEATIGKKAFGFMWTAVVCLQISSILYCFGGVVGRRDRGYTGRSTRRRGFFRPKRISSSRSRRSFANGNKDYT